MDAALRTEAPVLPRERSRALWAVVALGAILLFNLLFTRNFFALSIRDGHLFGTLVDVMHRATPIALMAVGMTFAIATRGIDVSVGSVAAVSGAVAATLIAKEHAPLWLAVAAPLAATTLLGAWNGLLVAGARIQPIVATLVLMVAGRGIAQLVTEGQIVVYEDRPFEFIGSGHLLGLPFSLTLLALVAGGAWLLARRTAFGLFVETIGINRSAARFSGIRTGLVLFVIYALSGLCAGVAGLLYAADIKAADANTAGLNAELDAILAVVIGGTSMDGGRFSLAGSVLGSLVIQSLNTTILTRGVPVEVTLVVKSLVVFAICLLQSEAFRRGAARLLPGRRGRGS